MLITINTIIIIPYKIEHEISIQFFLKSWNKIYVRETSQSLLFKSMEPFYVVVLQLLFSKYMEYFSFSRVFTNNLHIALIKLSFYDTFHQILYFY